jgi:hypothetical protein
MNTIVCKNIDKWQERMRCLRKKLKSVGHECWTVIEKKKERICEQLDDQD